MNRGRNNERTDRSNERKKALEDFQKRLGYVFADGELLELALTHRSYTRDEKKGVSNERLEFLGDAFLDAIVGDELYGKLPESDEGMLTKCRSAVVCESSLADKGKDIRIGDVIKLGKGEEAAGGRERPSITADAMEAVIGAVYLDKGFDAVKSTVVSLFEERIRRAIKGELFDDYKSRLQEIVQRDGAADIKYEILKESGPAHDRRFLVEVKVNGKAAGMGFGKSKKEAEQEAARKAVTGEENDVL